MELPVCRWRTMRDDGHATCSSVKIRGGDKPFDPARVCVKRDGSPCFAVDHEPLTPEQLAEREARRKAIAETRTDPGYYLAAMLAQLGISIANCNCAERARQMNAWGIEGCKQHRLEIAGWLREAAVEHLGKELPAGVTDPVEAFLPLVDEAVRRAAEHQFAVSPCVGPAVNQSAHHSRAFVAGNHPIC